MMIGINTYFFQIVMLTTYPQAFLCIGNSWIYGACLFPKKIILELVHACIGKHQGRVVFHHNRCRRNNLMSL